MSLTLARSTAASVLLLAVAGTARAQDCSVPSQNGAVRDILFEYYLWYRELPGVDPALFDSPEAYLEAARFRPLDTSFSFITGLAEFEAFNQNNELVGFGFSLSVIGDDQARLVEVFEESAAWDAGLRRGDFLLEIDGRGVAELLASGELASALGPSEAGVSRELRWRTPSGDAFRAVVVKRTFEVATVGETRVLDSGGLPVGYILFRNFSEPSFEALDRAFADFKAQGVADLILDVRYNGGGLVDVARHLGSLIGGLRTNGRVFGSVRHNDKNADRNRDIRFQDPPQALDLPRVVIITTRSSASSSELVINGLKPFIPVTVVGDRTFGKPVGQFGFEICDKIFFPVAFETVNANGEGGFFDGLPVNCPAGDDLNRALGDPGEASIAEALHVLRTGSCSSEAAAAGIALRARPESLATRARDGFRQLTNAW